MYMFGKINNKQNIVDISSAKLFNNSIFIGVQTNIDEEKLYKDVQEVIHAVVYWKHITTQSDLGTGSIQPLRITFATDELVFPLRISSINNGESEVLLYALTDHRMESEGFKTEFAGTIKSTRSEDQNEPHDKIGSYNSRNYLQEELEKILDSTIMSIALSFFISNKVSKSALVGHSKKN